MTRIKCKQGQQFGERIPSVRLHEVLPGDQQMQTWRVVRVHREANRRCEYQGVACRL